MLDLGEIVVGDDATRVTTVRHRAMHTLPVIVGFTTGCGVGALYEAAAGLSSLALPTCLALVAFAMCLMRRRLALWNTIG